MLPDLCSTGGKSVLLVSSEKVVAIKGLKRNDGANPRGNECDRKRSMEMPPEDYVRSA